MKKAAKLALESSPKTSYMIAPIPYTIYYPPEEQEGTVKGPTYPDFLIPENPYGTLGAIIPLLTALGLDLIR